MRRAGFSVEVLTSNFSSFDASRYGALLLIDPEEPYHPTEARKLVEDVTRRGLGLLVAADWHDPALMRQLRYTDEHTHVDNVCASGGANVPALNRLLAPLGIGSRSNPNPNPDPHPDPDPDPEPYPDPDPIPDPSH